jgi:hypothetical protein
MAEAARRTARAVAWATFCVAAVEGAAPLAAQGHGPVYGLSTPTLGRGGWSLDVAAMGRRVGGEGAAMVRPMLSYGLTEDLQLSLSVPLPLETVQGAPQAHTASRMPTSRDAELLLGWRFHRNATGVGARFESTLYTGLDLPTVRRVGPYRTSPGLYAAAVTGYASRTFYVWAGGLYRRYVLTKEAGGDRLGDVGMYSLVLGYRPRAFRRELPHPDWRMFVEVVGEYTGPNRLSGAVQPGTGGHRLFVAPTLLGLYGNWGVSGGPAFPVYARVNGEQPDEGVRLVVNTTYWF